MYVGVAKVQTLARREGSPAIERPVHVRFPVSAQTKYELRHLKGTAVTLNLRSGGAHVARARADFSSS
jgi:hypothetical protein